MIDEAATHPEYKSTAEPWLPEIPTHWRMERLKSLLRQRSEKGYPDEPLLAATQTKGVVRKEDYGSRTVMATKDFHLLKLVKRGDFVISLRSFQGGIEYARHQGIISPAYTILHTEDTTLHGYLAALFKSRPFIGNLTLYVTGIRQGQNIDYEKLSRSFVPVPPPEEQAAIVRFLAEADRRINRLIRNKRRLIELLSEQKQAIITQAVTRGLDPSVPMKASGLDGVWEIPQHWEILALKRVLRRLIDCEHKTAPLAEDGHHRVVRTSAVKQGRFVREGTYTTDPDSFRAWTRRGIPEPGDVVFTREAPAGEACLVPDGVPVCLGQRTVLMKVRANEYVPEFLIHTIYAGPPSHRIRLASQGSTVGHFNMDDIGWMPILRPPVEEQQAILAYIREHTTDIDVAISRSESEIDLIREYRTRLIADVVTGKLDVRAAAADLPDPADTEPEPADTLDDDADLDAAEEGLEEEVAR